MTTTLSVRPKSLDFSLYAGDSFAVSFVFTDQETSDPYPLTGTWEAHVRDKGVLVTEFTIDDTFADEGRLSLSLTGEQTAELALLGTPLWDLQQSFAGGPRTWYRGAINLTGDITHDE